MRLAKKGVLEKVSYQGLYYIPKISKWGKLGPEPIEVIKALERKYREKFIPGGNVCLNMLGLSNQVPGKLMYHTTHVIRQIRLGGSELQFRKVSPSRHSGAGSPAGIVLNAITYLGPIEGSLVETFEKLTDVIPLAQAGELVKHSGTRPVWVREIVKKLACRVENER